MKAKFQIDEVKDDDSEGDAEHDELAATLEHLAIQQHTEALKQKGVTKLTDLIKMESADLAAIFGSDLAKVEQEVESIRQRFKMVEAVTDL